MIYSFSPFDYEGSLVTVEADLRRGIPLVDIIGLPDGAVSESRERMRACIRNSGYKFPNERVLISLSPADLKKECIGFDLPMALAVLSAKAEYPENQDTKVLVMGELELSGNLRPIKAVSAALSTAYSEGIEYAIIPEMCDAISPSNKMKVIKVKNLREAYNALIKIDENKIDKEIITSTKTDTKDENQIEFDEISNDNLDSIKRLNGLKFAMAVAAAGGHHLLAYGKPGCGKSMLLQRMPELLPHLTMNERFSTTRIHSLAGLLNSSNEYMKRRPFRIPHQTASIEGICGGGVNCRPGEISLAHNGVLFLDEAAEFRSSVLQMLRVPLETRSITLSRAGRTTKYPAHFQFIMATNPCPCGNYGSSDKVCLCSGKAVEQYWKKFSAPLLDRISIRYNCNNEDTTPEYKLIDLRNMIKRAYEREYKRQGYLNQDLSVVDISRYCQLSKTASIWFDKASLKYSFSPRTITNLVKLARTLSDMTSVENEKLINEEYIKKAVELFGSHPLYD